jgi:hypothetical protein
MYESNHRIGKSALILILAIAPFGVSLLAQGQSSAPQNLAWAREFLWTMYPQLRGHNYAFSTNAYSPFDVPVKSFRGFTVQIGEAPPGRLVGYAGGGYLGPKPPNEEVEPGPVYAKQFLVTNFIFDKDERLSSFVAGGPEAERPEADHVARNLRELSPEWTDAQAVTELKKAGAMYVPAEKEKFVKTLPIGDLEKLFGKITVVSAEFKMQRNSELSTYGQSEWLVVMRAKQTNGTQLTYKMIFEPFKGVLTNMEAVAP